MALGDSHLPFGPVAGGSNSTGTVGSAIIVAAGKMRSELAFLAVADPTHGNAREILRERLVLAAEIESTLLRAVVF